jgi:hypothetical protein
MQGKIEVGSKFYTYDYCTRVFILLHEVGHFFYKKEPYCDLFAAKHFILKGYNNCTAMYSLSKVLNCSSGANKERVLNLFNNLNFKK